MCWRSLGNADVLKQANSWHKLGFAWWLFVLMCAALTGSFVKLCRIVGFRTSIVTTLILIGISYTLLLLANDNAVALALIPLVLYLLSVAILAVCSTRVPEKICAFAQAIALYYSAFLGPLVIVLGLEETHLLPRMTGGEFLGFICVFIVSAGLKVFSSFVCDRLSHQPR